MQPTSRALASSDDESDSDRNSVRNSDDSTATLDYNPDDDLAC